MTFIITTIITTIVITTISIIIDTSKFSGQERPRLGVHSVNAVKGLEGKLPTVDTEFQGLGFRVRVWIHVLCGSPKT